MFVTVSRETDLKFFSFWKILEAPNSRQVLEARLRRWIFDTPSSALHRRQHLEANLCQRNLEALQHWRDHGQIESSTGYTGKSLSQNFEAIHHRKSLNAHLRRQFL